MKRFIQKLFLIFSIIIIAGCNSACSPKNLLLIKSENSTTNGYGKSKTNTLKEKNYNSNEYFPKKVKTNNDEYPKTREERKADEIGSIVGGEGILFRPGKIKNESTKTNSLINDYLWNASLELVNNHPINSVDSKSGIIITDWYKYNNDTNTDLKLNIRILDNVISPKAIEVKAFIRIFKNGKWVDKGLDSIIASHLEEEIIRKARELYLNNKSK